MSARNHLKVTSWLVIACCAVFLQACKHPLAIVGEGDIVDIKNSTHGCTLEQFRAGDGACTENEVSGDYFVNYKAVPRPGWRFVRWQGPCSPASHFQHCGLGASKAMVDWWDETYPEVQIPPSTAVFQRIEGETGYLLAGTAVAGVAYETATQHGVTGLDGSFQYEKGETVRFMIGDTLLGEVKGQVEVTPFDLAGSPVLTGIEISWALGQSPYPNQSFDWEVYGPASEFKNFERAHPFNTVVNIAVVLHSLDEDARPENGIVIRPGVSSLFDGVSLNLRQGWMDFLKQQEWPRDTAEYRDLHHSVGEANKKHRFRSAHGIVSPAIAMQHLYKTLGIDAKTYVTCPKVAALPPGFPDMPEFTERDLECRYDDQGNITFLDGQSWKYDANHRIVEAKEGRSVERFQYDKYGNTVLHSRDRDGDGMPENVERWNYDDYGNITRYEEDHDGDGLVDTVETWTYDQQGRPQAFEGDGHTKRWDYNSKGDLVRYRDSYPDTDKSGRESTEIWKYDTKGRVTLAERTEIEALDAFVIAGNDPPGYSRGNLYLNGNSLPSSEINDIAFRTYVIGSDSGSPKDPPVKDQGQIFLTDGTVPITGDQLSQSITTGIAGQLVGIEIHWNSCIPVPAPVLKFSVISGPNPPRGKVLYSEEIDLDGVDTSDSSLFTWDISDADLFFNAGDQFSFVMEALSIGSRCSRSEIEEFEYDLDGTVTKQTRNVDGDTQPVIESIDIYTFDARGQLVRYESGSDKELLLDRVDEWEYDIAGNLTRHQQSNRHGVERIDSWQYDEQGKLIRHETSSDDGQVGYETWEYDSNRSLVRYEANHDMNGVDQKTHYWEYDAQGNLIRHEFDSDDGELFFERWFYGKDSELQRYERNFDYYDQLGEMKSWDYRSTGWGHVFGTETPGLFKCSICEQF